MDFEIDFGDGEVPGCLFHYTRWNFEGQAVRRGSYWTNLKTLCPYKASDVTGLSPNTLVYRVTWRIANDVDRDKLPLRGKKLEMRETDWSMSYEYKVSELIGPDGLIWEKMNPADR